MKAIDDLALAAYNILREYCRQHPYNEATQNCDDCIFSDTRKSCLMDGHLVNSCPQDWPEVRVIK